MPRTLQAAFTCIALIMLCACTTPRDRLLALAHASQAEASVIQTSLFPLQVVAPKALHISNTLTIYIEGDGHAWATATQPSLDPSPHSLGVTSLALAPEHPGIYLARPCQFVMNEHCHPTLWTDARFSGAVVDAMQSALDILKARYHASSLELIGYSGGAAIALLLAQHRDDIVQVQTIAGNLDPFAWVKLKGFSPLAGSIDPLLDVTRLSTTRQRHFIAAQDRVLPAALATGFVQKTKPKCVELVEVPGTHASVMESFAAGRLGRPIACQ